VVVIDKSMETGARNERRIAVMYLNTTSGFEIIHGTLDLLMTKIGSVFSKDYAIKESNDPMYFSKRGASINFKGKVIGSIGVLHPEVLTNFNLKFPVSCFEITLDDLFEHFKHLQD
jgi:phenylalanyl-tRNA synthetase beta chain